LAVFSLIGSGQNLVEFGRVGPGQNMAESALAQIWSGPNLVVFG